MAHDRERRSVKPPAGKKPSSRLTPEERELWEHTASSITPIKGKKGRVHAALEDADPVVPKREAAKAAAAKGVAPASAPSTTRAGRTPPAPPPAPLSLERKKTRKLSSGRIEIEARIDLHGMRQSEAYSALHRFLQRSYADGKRWVLVITGKGAPQRTSLDERDGADARGVLRRNVPRWLAEPELAPIVIGFTTASIKHGGEGALYIHVRKRPGTPEPG